MIFSNISFQRVYGQILLSKGLKAKYFIPKGLWANIWRFPAKYFIPKDLLANIRFYWVYARLRPNLSPRLDILAAGIFFRYAERPVARTENL
jgi:hypothetical protein